MVGLGSMFPLTRLALDSRSQLDIVRQLGFGIPHQLPPDGSDVFFSLALDPSQTQINLPAMLAIAWLVVVAFLLTVVAITITIVTGQSGESVFFDPPSAWFLVHPTANPHFVNCARLQVAQRNVSLRDLGSVIPLRGLPLNSTPQLHVVKNTHTLLNHRSTPMNHGSRRSHFPSLDVSRHIGSSRYRLAKR